MGIFSPKLEKAKVKSWFASKGYGFLSIDGKPDIFVHVSALPSGIKKLDEGQEVKAKVEDSVYQKSGVKKEGLKATKIQL